MKRLRWVGTTLDEVSGYAADVRRAIGFELFAVQRGLMPTDFKAMPQVGKGAYEIRVHVQGEWRVIYVARLADAVYVLHAFQKKSQKTPLADIELAARSHRIAGWE